MRNLFLALLLANLAFAAWHSWFAPAPSILTPRADELPEIVLASEREESDTALPAAPVTGPVPAGREAPADAEAEPAPQPGPAEQAGALTAAAEAADAPSSCIRVGPFRELSQAATAAANLRESGFEPMQRAGEGDVWVGYWVYIEQIPSVDEAEAMLARLRENGISDAYIIPRSDSGTLISLGVFTEIARASNRREQARELGLEATISDRTRRATVYWIEVMLARGELLDFEQLQPPGRIIRLEQRPCEASPG